MAAAVRTLRSPSLSRLRKDSKDSKDNPKEVTSTRTRKESKDLKARRDTGESTSGRLSLRHARSTSSSNIEAVTSGESPTKPSTRRLPTNAYPAAKREPVMENHLRVLLPNKQKTMLKCEPGVTLEKALLKALKRRNLTFDVVKAYKFTPKKQLVAWDTELTHLERLEIVVEDRVSVVREHQFVNRGNMRITYCDVCHKLMVSGALCSACGVKVHQRCIRHVLPGLPCNPTGAANNDNVSSLMSHVQPPELSLSAAALDSFKDDEVLGPYFMSSSEKLKRTDIVTISLQGDAIARLYSSASPSGASEDSEGGDDEFQGRRTSSQRRRSTMDRWGSAPSLATTEADASGSLPSIVSEEPPTGSDQNGSAAPEHGESETVQHSSRGTVDPHSVTTKRTGSKQVAHSPASANSESVRDSAQTESSRATKTTGEHSKELTNQGISGGITERATTLPRGVTLYDPILRSKPFEEPTWEIKFSEVTILERVGAGAYGTVYKGEWHGCVAVKKMHMKNPSREQLEIFSNEVHVLKNTRHSNILLFMGCILEPELAIVTAWCEGSNLYQHLHIRSTRFESKQIIRIAKHVSQGMDYLHAKGIIHRDLKSANVLLEHERVPYGRAPPTVNVKVADFGLSSLGGGAKSRQMMGSILWMAPEIIRMDLDDPYTAFSDVYAFGIILFELMTSSLPYTEIDSRDQILWMVGRGDLRPDLNAATVRADLPTELKKIFQKCTAFNPEKRANFMYVLDGLLHVERVHANMPKISRRNSLPNIPF